MASSQRSLIVNLTAELERRTSATQDAAGTIHNFSTLVGVASHLAERAWLQRLPASKWPGIVQDNRPNIVPCANTDFVVCCWLPCVYPIVSVM